MLEKKLERIMNEIRKYNEIMEEKIDYQKDLGKSIIIEMSLNNKEDVEMMQKEYKEISKEINQIKAKLVKLWEKYGL